MKACPGIFVALMLVVSTALCASAGETDPVSSRSQKLLPERGAIISIEDAKKNFSSDGKDQFWLPAQSQVDVLDEKLSAALARKLINRKDTPPVQTVEFYRQYIGLDENQRRFVLVIGIHKSLVDYETSENAPTTCVTYPDGVEAPCQLAGPPKSAKYWQHENIASGIYDGCTSIFYARFDVQTQEISRLTFDGCA